VGNVLKMEGMGVVSENEEIPSFKERKKPGVTESQRLEKKSPMGQMSITRLKATWSGEYQRVKRLRRTR